MKFTLEQINHIHDRLGSAETLAQYVQALNNIGVQHADSYSTDRHTEFFAKDGYSVKAPGAHEALTISQASDRQGLLHYLNLHNSGNELLIDKVN